MTSVAHVVAVANLKGGVAKTTTVASVGAALASAGRGVLLVDLDPQACLTYAVGVDPADVTWTVADVLVSGVEADRATVSTAEGPALLASDLALADAERVLGRRPGREHVLSRALEPVLADLDVVLVDCPPSLGVLTLAALAASDALLVPMTADMLAHRAVGQVLDAAADVREAGNPRLSVLGLLPTMVDMRGSHAREVVADARRRFGAEFGVDVLDPVPRSVRVVEAAALGRSVLTTSPRSRAATAYRSLAARLDRAAQTAASSASR